MTARLCVALLLLATAARAEVATSAFDWELGKDPVQQLYSSVTVVGIEVHNQSENGVCLRWRDPKGALHAQAIPGRARARAEQVTVARLENHPDCASPATARSYGRFWIIYPGEPERA